MNSGLAQWELPAASSASEIPAKRKSWYRTTVIRIGDIEVRVPDGLAMGYDADGRFAGFTDLMEKLT